MDVRRGRNRARTVVFYYRRLAFRLFFWYFLQCLLLSRPRYHCLSTSLFPAPHFRDHSGFGPCLEVKWRRVFGKLIILQCDSNIIFP